MTAHPGEAPTGTVVDLTAAPEVAAVEVPPELPRRVVGRVPARLVAPGPQR